MISAVCTLFEGTYHLGLAILANSLYAQGFRGKIWAGYRGPLPPWAEGRTEFVVAEGCAIVFVPLATAGHLTNHKPDFMLEVARDHAPACGALFYLDPDIVVCEAWQFFEEWVSCGLAVCEDVNSPLATGHPRRIGWRRFFGGHGLTLEPRLAEYANGGFLGATREHWAFLKLWKQLQDIVWMELGGSQFAGIAGGESVSGRSGFADCFGKTDQDILNAALEASALPVSFLGRPAMGFVPGHAILPHALGSRKPWHGGFLAAALGGRPPRLVDKEFWRAAEGPIRPFDTGTVRRQRAALAAGALLGRFYTRT